MSISDMSTRDLVAWLRRWRIVQVQDVETGAIVTADIANEGAAEMLREAADRIEYLESVAGAVSQAPEASPFAKRQRDG